VSIGLPIDCIVLGLLDWCAEVLLEIQLRSDRDVRETRILLRPSEDVVLDVVYFVVGDHVMRDTVDRNAHGLLDETISSEAVAIDKRTDERALELLVLLGAGSTWLRIRVDGWLWWSDGSRHLGDFLSIRFATLEVLGTRNAAAFTLDGTLLLARRERLVEFAVDQEVAQDATGTPSDTVGPSFDTASIFFVDENVAALDQLAALAIMGTSWDVVKLAAEAGLEEDEAIHTVLDESMEGGHQRSCSACAHDGDDVRIGGEWCLVKLRVVSKVNTRRMSVYI
jgi:hypothetical protein